MKKVVIKLESFNGPKGKHTTTNFEFAQFDELVGGQASSYRVQFNINKAAVDGTIFVDKNNFGIAKATIEGNFLLSEGWAVLDPLGSNTIKLEKNNSSIEDAIEIKPHQLSNKEIIFTVKKIGESVGSVTVIFFVRFKKTL